jgi:hypothetical protein
MRTPLVTAIAAGAIGALALACSSKPPPDPYATVDEFCAAYAKAICQISSTCQFDATACQMFQSTACVQNAGRSTSSGSRQYKSSNVQPCIDALNSAYGNSATSVSAATLSDIDGKCQHVFAGGAGHGKACQTDFDCTQSGDICATAPGVGSVCATPTPKNDGDYCADPGDQCPSTDYCQPQGGTSKCVAAVPMGQPCSASMPCDGNDRCLAGVCEVLAQQGQVCSATSDCSAGLLCDTYTSAAAPEPACVTALTFARGSVDCLGIEGRSTPPVDAGSPAGDASGSTDAPAGG